MFTASVNPAATQDTPAANPMLGEMERLVCRYRATKDEALRARIVKQFERLTYSIAHRFTWIGEPLEDLVQEGYLGLLRAIDLYDATKGVRFSTYAAFRITSTLEHYIRDRVRLIRQPAWIQERNHRIKRETDRLRSLMGREPETEEVAQSMELPVEQVEEAMVQLSLSDLESLDDPMDESGSATRGESIAAADGSAAFEDRLTLERLSNTLTGVERSVIDLIFYREMTQREAAQTLGFTPSRVRRVLDGALKRLRREMVQSGYEARMA